jgi:hypothetical protein|tara:strand:+ start:1602 stop:1715 length:114 start_codon:yes stop_codon:yes gene_type:complete
MGIVAAMVKDLEHIEIVRQWKEELEALYAEQDVGNKK